MQKTKYAGIYKRGSRYVVTWRDRGKQHRESFRTLSEARAAKRKRATGETQPASSARFDDYAQSWLDTYNGRDNEGLAPSTRKNLSRAITKHAIPYFGHMRLKDIRRKDVEGFVRHMQNTGVNPPSVQKNLQAVKVLLTTAVIHGDLPASPSSDMRHKRGAAPSKPKVLTRAQLGLLLAALPEDERPFFVFLAQTGLRISEAIGLRWEDVDLGARPHIKVRRQNYKGVERQLKTQHSRRDVPLTPGMRDTSLALRASRYAGPQAPLWGTKTGKPLDAHNMRTRVLRPVVISLGLVDEQGKPWVGFHTLRHTCASLLFEAGRDVKQVQEWLGHADPGFTLRRYVHLMDDGLGDAAFLDDVVGNASISVVCQRPEANKRARQPQELKRPLHPSNNGSTDDAENTGRRETSGSHLPSLKSSPNPRRDEGDANPH